MVYMIRALTALTVVVLLLVFSGNAFAQGSEIYTLTHLEAAAEKKDAISANMGGVYAATPHFGSGNGAALGLVDGPTVKLAASNTKLGGIQIDGFEARYYGKVGKVGFMVGTNDSRTNTFTIAGKTINGRESDKVFGLGFPVAEHLYLGVQMAPEMSTYYTVTGETSVPPIPVPVPFSQDLRSGAVNGGSYGVLYVNRNFNVGVDYRSYNENTWAITALTSVFLGGTIQRSIEEAYKSDRMQAAVRLNDVIRNVDVSVGYYDNRFKGKIPRAELNGNPYEFNYTKLQYGGNFKFSPALQVQIGSNDGEFTGGFSWALATGSRRDDRNFTVQFCYAHNQFKKLVQKINERTTIIENPNHDSLDFMVNWRF